MNDPRDPRGGWRDLVLREFPRSAGELLLVADPDGVLADDALQNSLASLGYEVVYYDDPFAFRAWYERGWRASLERGGAGRSLALVLSVARTRLSDAVPYDIARMGRRVDVGLARLFPNLDPAAVCALDPQHLDALWEAIQGDDAQRGPESTQDFLLRAVFGLDLAGLPHSRTPGARLLVALLQMHFRGLHLPDALAARAVERTRGIYALKEWPLALLFGARAGFLAFLQRQWDAWVARIAGSGRQLTSDIRAAAGPAEVLDITFADPDLIQSLEPYFLHGLLVAVPLGAEARLPPQHAWAAVGIDQDPGRDALRRLERLLGKVDVPAPQAPGNEWSRFALSLAEAAAFQSAAAIAPDHPASQHLLSLAAAGEAAFLPWLRQRYGGMASLPSIRGPVMVHHTAPFMAARLAAGAERVALLVMDGLALDQWVVLRGAMPPLAVPATVDEGAAFAWIPTLTNVSRQAIFAGMPPWSFAGTLENLSAEGTWWQKFWDQRGVSAGQVRYLKKLDPATPDALLCASTDPGVRVVGAVVPLVDQLIHDFPLPRRDLVPVLANWAREGHLSRLVSALLDARFEVFLTADHGNVDARGMGTLDEGKVPDIRGQRVRVYASEALRDAAVARCPGAEPWTGAGLPAGFCALLAPGDRAFVAEGGSLICHGGASLAEVLVPFVHIRRVAR